jgi:hypothetical protein
MSRVGFEPTTPVFEQTKTVHALDCTATVIVSVRYVVLFLLEHGASLKHFVSLEFLNLRHSVGFIGQVISPSQGRYSVRYRTGNINSLLHKHITPLQVTHPTTTENALHTERYNP